LPEINPRLNAWTGTAGIHGKQGPLDGDLSVTYGGDTFHFYVDNSLNASLGDASPTHFDAGRLKYDQTSLNFDGVWHVDPKPVKLSVVGGAEVRRETYGITAGQPESYELGPETKADGSPKVPGSQVFPGFRPSDASSNSRLSEAVYGGIELQPIARANIDAGGRFEHYSDFGNTLTGKLAGRLAVVKTDDNEVALRGSVSNGFRAPGLQQIWYSTIATQFVNDPANAGKVTPTNILISPNQSAVTEAFGVPRLKEETSVNFSGGFTARLFGNLSLSTDYYHVTIKDRVVLSGQFSAGDDVIGAQVAEVLAPFAGVGRTQFFVNAVDTTTNGVDVVLDYGVRLPGGALKLTGAANYTKTQVDDVRVPDSMKDKFMVDGGAKRVSDLFLGRYGRNRLEDLTPHAKGTVGAHLDMQGWSGGIRTNYFGRTKYHADETDADGNFLDESFGAKITVDLDVGYRTGGLFWSVGANNVFNNFPDELKHPENRNSDSFLYSPASVPAGAPYGTDGAFYYVRADYRF
jgi:iron complex outermembrane receptor protein